MQSLGTTCKLEDADAIDAAEQSIEWLHDFLEGWFRGAEKYTAAGAEEAGGDEVAFGAFCALFDVEHFAYIYPGGTQEDAAGFLPGMRAAFGVNPAFRIRVPRATMRLRVVATVPAAAWGGEAHFLVAGTYHEFQSGARNSAPENARVSSPLLRVWRPCAGAAVGGGAHEEDQEEAPWRVQWLHLHETWLPEGTQPPSATADAE